MASVRCRSTLHVTGMKSMVRLPRRWTPDLGPAADSPSVPGDIRMPGTDGLEATRQIAADPGLNGVRVIISTTFPALANYARHAIGQVLAASP
jgi:CheY-like chemotaxis protein